MEKLLKYCLSLILIANLFSCKKEGTNLNTAQKKELAEKTYKAAVQYRQGSTAFQNGIVDAIKINPNYEQAVYELSVAHLKRGMPHKWKPQYNKAVLLDSIGRIPWRGYLYLWFYRDYKKAIADFDASDKLTPNFIDCPQGQSVDYWRGIAYLGLKDYKNSIAYFDKHIIKETKDAGEDWVEITSFLYRGIAYYESGDYKNALISFDLLLKYADNNYADGKYYKALIYKEQKKIQEAKTLVLSAIDDFYNEYYNHRPYVEDIRQIYLEDLENLSLELEKTEL